MLFCGGVWRPLYSRNGRELKASISPVEYRLDATRRDVGAQHRVAVGILDAGRLGETGIDRLQRNNVHRALFARHQDRLAGDLPHLEADEIRDRVVVMLAMPFLDDVVFGLRVGKALEQVQIEIAGARLLFLDNDLGRKEIRPAGFLLGNQLVDVRFLVAVRFSDFGDVLVERAHRHGARCAEGDTLLSSRWERAEIESKCGDCREHAPHYSLQHRDLTGSDHRWRTRSSDGLRIMSYSSDFNDLLSTFECRDHGWPQRG